MNYSDYGVYDTLSLVSGLLKMGEEAKARFEALPEEEKKRILAERERRKERKRVNLFIQQGKCPYCGKKLIRGKKDKQNDYKRAWKCAYCDRILQVEREG